MGFEDLILKLETDFFILSGIKLQGISGLLFGTLLFISLLYLLKDKATSSPSLNESDLSDIGDPISTQLNLARSLYEMGKVIEAKKLVEGISQENINELDKKNLDFLKSKIQ